MLRHVRQSTESRLRCAAPVFALLCLALLCLAQGGAHAADQTVQGVQFHQEGRGWALRDTNGMSLYVFSKDEQPGKSTCLKLCVATWPAYAATVGDKGEGDLSIITRDDETLQWAFRGKPLYHYVRDSAPGETNGDGAVNGAWSAAYKEIERPAGVSIAQTLKGWVLVDDRGMTLYASDSDKPKKTPSCEVDCARTWLPLRAPALAAASIGDWSIVVRADGSKQWAYKDKPLYAYAQDFAPGDALGDGVQKGWRAMVLDPPAPVPAWLTVQATDDADVYGDRVGMTIYVHDIAHAHRAAAGAAADDSEDGPMRRPQDWKPVLAAADEKPVGDWTIVRRKNGDRQWAYKGLWTYTNVNDTHPGELNGVRRDDLTWRVITITGKNLNGTGA